MKVTILKKIFYTFIILWTDIHCGEEIIERLDHFQVAVQQEEARQQDLANYNYNLALGGERVQHQQDSHKREFEDFPETLINNHIETLKSQYKNIKQNPFEEWELEAIRFEDDWLSNESIPELLLSYLAAIDAKLYNIIDPVDVQSNWWEVTRQLLESINQQLNHQSSHQLSLFTIVPLNFGNVHWAAMVIEKNLDDFSRPLVYFFDSLGSTQKKLAIIETIVKDTQLFSNPHIIDLSSPQLRQKDGKTCGTWMLEAIKAIIQARQTNLLQQFIHQALTSVNMEARHAINLLKQRKKRIKDTKKPPFQPKQETASTKTKKEKRDLTGDDVWVGKEAQSITYDANKTAQSGHPNQEGDLNRIIVDLLNSLEHLSVKQLHEMSYQELVKLPKYKGKSVNYSFRYNTNTDRVESLHFLHLFVVTNEPKLLDLALNKCLPNLINIIDSQGNTILHLAAYYGFHQMVDIIINYAKNHGHLKALINDRNHDGTNPLGMFFLHCNQISAEHWVRTVEPFIMEPSFEINRYLNNKRGMDVFAPAELMRIGGLNCLHMALKEKYERILKLLTQRNSTLPPESQVNFSYPAMNPERHMWHPSKFANASNPSDDVAASQGIQTTYGNLPELIEDDDSGDSSDEETPAWHYKRGLMRLSQFIDEKQGKKDSVNTTILNSPSKTPLTPPEKAQAEKDITKVSVVHFHGVPFMQGHLTNHERREVGKKFIEINQEYLANGLENSERNQKLKAIYSRTATASVGIESHKMLIDASDEELDELTRLNHVLRELLAKFYSTSKLEFLSVIKTYINNFNQPGTMRFFWNNVMRDTLKELVRYRFPIASTGKSPDHAFKYGMGFNVEGSLRGEKPIRPSYKNGTPKHRLAGFLYLIITPLATYRDMENNCSLIDPVQYHKAAQLTLSVTTLHQSETTFLGGIDGEHIGLVLPLLYLNFKEKNKERYKKMFSLTERNWQLGRSLMGNIQERVGGKKTNHHSKEFKLLMQIYLPFAIKLAQAISTSQGTALHFIDALGNLQRYSESTIDANGTFRTEAQDAIKNQVYSKSPEGKIKTGEKAEKKYHVIEGPKLRMTVFDGPEKVPQGIDQLLIPLTTSAIQETTGLGQPTSAFAQDENLEQITLLAQQGNNENQYKLARIYREKAYRENEKETRDQKAIDIYNSEAVTWYSKAAEQGHILAQFYLGFMYENGLGIQQNTTKAIEWYTKAANQGNKDAIKQLEILNKGGDQPTTPLATSEVQETTKLSKPAPALAQTEDEKLFRKAAEQGDRESQYKLARLHREKAKETRDQKAIDIHNSEAVKWYSKAAEQGHTQAQFYLSFMYENGLGIQQNTTKAIEWYTKAANQGDTDAVKQ